MGLPFGHPGGLFRHGAGSRASLPSLVSEDSSGSWETQSLPQNDFRGCVLGLLGDERCLERPEGNWTPQVWGDWDACNAGAVSLAVPFGGTCTLVIEGHSAWTLPSTQEGEYFQECLKPSKGLTG